MIKKFSFQDKIQTESATTLEEEPNLETFRPQEITEVYAWGNNSKGQLGFDSSKVQTVPRSCSFSVAIS
jgi:alpha-tubulin suppressor-like RCC1 family protein